MTESWPPKQNLQISVFDPNDKKKYSGVVKNTIWNSTACVIQLNDNNSNNYVENSLNSFQEYNFGNGHFLLLPSYKWKYIHNISNDIQSPINSSANASSFVGNVVLTPNVQTNKKINLENTHINNNQYFVPTNTIITNKKTDPSKKIINNFNNFTANLKPITNDMKEDAQNSLYRPLLFTRGVDFIESAIDNLFDYDAVGYVEQLSNIETDALFRRLNDFSLPSKRDVRESVNKNIAINNIISDPDDELNEGNRMVKLIKKITFNIFDHDLIFKIHAGYVHFSRKGAVVNDIVTRHLVPNLHYFNWQQGKPIDYHTLKYVIFQNEYQQSIDVNIAQKKEAEHILGLEYIIALQCKSEYQLWCFKRILMMWYSDKEIEQTIRKIKLLINHYRADPMQTYNENNGILPMIVIYPRYGVESARKLISKLEYYFSLYLEDNFNNTYNSIPWSNSNPTYFLKKNNLFYYTNGSLDLKMYIKESANCTNCQTQTSLMPDLSKVKINENVIRL